MTRLRSTKKHPDHTYESRIQAAADGLSRGLYKTVSAAARSHDVRVVKFRATKSLSDSRFNKQVVRKTLSDRVSGLHESRVKGHSKGQQLLSTVQEDVLIDWCELSSAGATPIGPKTLRAHAFAISGKHPGKHWHERFAKRHPTLKLSKPTSLDLK
jgi:hypothetical protein